MSDKYIEYKGETYEQALEVLERHAITKLVDRDGVSYVASMIAMFEGVEHMQAERIATLEAENAALRARLSLADKLAAALEIYATPDNWRQKDTRTGAFDWFLRGNAGWDIAQAALAAWRKGE